MTRIRKRNITAFLLCVSISAAGAFDVGSFAFDTMLSLGACGGETHELVFAKTDAVLESLDDLLDTRVSEIVWKTYASPLVSMREEMVWKQLFAFVEFQTVIPIMCGIAEDYDFLLTGSTDISQYSEHDAFSDKNFSLGAGLRYQFPFDVFPLQFGLSILWRVQKWSAYNGYAQYPSAGGPWTGNEEKQFMQGAVISYELSSVIAFLDLRIPILCEYDGGVFLDVSLSPSLAFYDALDSHFVRSKQFHDCANGTFLLNFCAVGYYRNFHLALGGCISSIAIGTTSTGPIGSAAFGMQESASSSGGLWYWSWTALFGYRF